MDEHLGYAKHAVEGRNHGNSWNGTRSRTVLTEIRPVELGVPTDRDSSFDPQTVRKGHRRLDGVDSMVIRSPRRASRPARSRRIGGGVVGYGTAHSEGLEA